MNAGIASAVIGGVGRRHTQRGCGREQSCMGILVAGASATAENAGPVCIGNMSIRGLKSRVCGLGARILSWISGRNWMRRN